MTHPITIVTPNGDPMYVSIHEKDTKDVPVAWAFVTVDRDDPKKATLCMIYVHEKKRGKGYGQELLHVLQSQFQSIMTQYSKGIINSAGTRLCLKCGFKMMPSLFKRIPSELVWERGA